MHIRIWPENTFCSPHEYKDARLICADVRDYCGAFYNDKLRHTPIFSTSAGRTDIVGLPHSLHGISIRDNMWIVDL